MEEMLSSVGHRGQDRQGIWIDGSVGLGSVLMFTTQESLNEPVPQMNKNRLAITADARIDNRDELIEACGLQGPANQITDTGIILAAYEKWGEDCPARLIGDFAFAIWDERKQHLFCARDPMGIKCFYYFSSPELFCFGSEIKALFCSPGVPKQLNELRVLDYLAQIFDDRSITFYRGVSRLPAASSITVSRSKLTSRLYWSLDANRELKLSSNEEYVEAFLECFTRAVRDRLRSAFPIGSALSGGLDSSSIACLAQRILSGPLLHTFSLIFPSLHGRELVEIDERQYMNDALNSGSFIPHFINADQLSPMGNVATIQKHLDEPFFAGNLYLTWGIFSSARSHGVRVLLDGLDGDTTISHGFEYLADLLLGLKWTVLNKEVRLLSKNLQMKPKQIVREYCVKPVCPTWVYSLWRRLHGRSDDAGIPKNTFINESFKTRLNLMERVGALISTSRSCTRNAREKHCEMLQFPLYAHALELADKVSAACGVENRYPFFDRRLIELCLALPAAQKLSDGWSRMILRKSMEGILPKSIQWRPDKANLSPNFYRQMLSRDREILDEILMTPSSYLEPYIDVPAMRQAYEHYKSDPRRYQTDAITLFGIVNLGIWLQASQVSA